MEYMVSLEKLSTCIFLMLWTMQLIPSSDTTVLTWTGSAPGCHLIPKPFWTMTPIPIRSLIAHQYTEFTHKLRIASRPSLAGEISAPRRRSERWCHRKHHMSASDSLACAHYFWAAFYFRNGDDNKQHTRTHARACEDSHSRRDSFSLRDLFPNIRQRVTHA